VHPGSELSALLEWQLFDGLFDLLNAHDTKG
jgi:hypothetical protein